LAGPCRARRSLKLGNRLVKRASAPPVVRWIRPVFSSSLRSRRAVAGLMESLRQIWSSGR